MSQRPNRHQRRASQSMIALPEDLSAAGFESPAAKDALQAKPKAGSRPPSEANAHHPPPSMERDQTLKEGNEKK
ncbi:hypothetical protein ACLOJK_001709, partial [Asimina triloba]